MKMVANHIEAKLLPECQGEVSFWSEKKKLRTKLKAAAIDQIFEKIYFIKNQNDMKTEERKINQSDHFKRWCTEKDKNKERKASNCRVIDRATI